MTIILQHQFWDLAVGDRGFEVGLSFGGITERLTVSFDAIIAFYDPAVQFGFQFEAMDAAADEQGDAEKAPDKGAQKSAANEGTKGATKSTTKGGEKTVPAPAALPAGKRASAAPPADEPPAPPPGTDGSSGGRRSGCGSTIQKEMKTEDRRRGKGSNGNSVFLWRPPSVLCYSHRNQ